MKCTFENPYPAQGKGLTSRVNVNILTEDLDLLYQVNPRSGPVQTTIGILIAKLIYELKRRNLTTYADQSSLRDFIANCVIADPDEAGRHAPVTSVIRASALDDKRAVAGQSNTPPPAAAVLGGVQGGGVGGIVSGRAGNVSTKKPKGRDGKAQGVE